MSALPIMFGQDAEAEDTGVEIEAPLIVGADNGDMMNLIQV